MAFTEGFGDAQEVSTSASWETCTPDKTTAQRGLSSSNGSATAKSADDDRSDDAEVYHLGGLLRQAANIRVKAAKGPAEEHNANHTMRVGLLADLIFCMLASKAPKVGTTFDIESNPFPIQGDPIQGVQSKGVKRPIEILVPYCGTPCQRLSLISVRRVVMGLK
jgi:hypothetical protein